MRAYFAPCGVGLGHAGRCIPIAERMRKDGSKVLFSTYGDAVGLVRRERLQIVESPPLLLDFEGDGAVNLRWSLLKHGVRTVFTILEQVNSEIQCIRTYSPDIVLSDTRVSTILAAKMLGLPVVLILNQFQVLTPRGQRLLAVSRLVDAGALTLMGRLWSLSNCVMIPDLPPPFTVSMLNLHIPEALMKNVELIGPIVEKRCQDLPESDEIRERHGLDRRPLVFVSFGGSQAGEILREKMINIATDFPRYLQVVMSLGRPADGPSRTIDMENLRVYSWIPSQLEMIKACDVVVGRAGHSTIMQAVSCGKPMILVPIPNHTEQMSNALGAQRLGIARVLRQDEFNRTSLLSEIKWVLECRSFGRRAAEVGRFAQRFDALGRVVEVVRTLVHK